MYHHIIWWLLIMHTPPLLLRRRRRLNHCVSTTELKMRFQIHRFRLHYVFNCTAHVRLGAAMHLVYLMMIRWMQHKYIINRHIFSSALLSSPQFFYRFTMCQYVKWNSCLFFNSTICGILNDSHTVRVKVHRTNSMLRMKWERDDGWKMKCAWIVYRDRCEYACCSRIPYNGTTHCFQNQKQLKYYWIGTRNQNLHNVNPALKLYVFFFPLFTVHLTWNVKSVKCKH